MSINPKTETTKRIKRTEAYAEKVRLQFAQTVNEILALNKRVPVLDEGVMFSFDGESMRIQKEVERLLRQLHSVATMAIKKGIILEWEIANDECDKLIASAFGKKVLESPEFSAWCQRNEAARDAFINRSDKGLKLSDRVWKAVRQLRDEMEVAMTVAIGEGDSAASMSKKVRTYLNDPDLMFRRFRYKKDEDAEGNPIYGRKWKKRIKDEATGKYKWIDYDRDDYKTGAGVYKSSAKNAMRVARTETNVAYRRADNERWQQMDFVLGQRIQLSRSHPKKDICDKLAGEYPKEFVFDGWHPQCFCFATPILIDEDEMAKITEAMLKGEKYTPRGRKITEYPESFKEWIRENAESIAEARDRGTEPYFIRNNAEAVDEILNPQERELTTLEKAAIRHANRTPEEIASIKARAAERQKKHQLIRTTANNILKVAGDYGEVDYSTLQKYVQMGDLTNMQEETRVVAKAISEMKKQEKALSKLIPNAHEWHKKFTLAELQSVYASIQKVYNRWAWNFDSETDIEHIIKKLTYEISWIETKGQKYATWEVAREAYKQKLALVQHRKQMLSIKSGISLQLSELSKSKSKQAKDIAAEFEALFKDDNADLADLRNKAANVQAKYDALEKQRQRNAKKKAPAPSGGYVPKSENEVKDDFIAYARTLGFTIARSDIEVDNGFIQFNRRQHERLYDSLKVETTAEHNQLWNHRAPSRWGAAGYVHTGNSFVINGDFRSTGLVGKLDNSMIAKLKARGATDDDIKTMKLLDEKTSKLSLPIPIRCTRYVQIGALKSIFGTTLGSSIKDAYNAMKGKSLAMRVDPAYLSVSTNENLNVFTHYPVKLEIEVPPNTPFYLTDNYHESEAVFGRSTKLQYLGVSKTTDYLIIRCRVIK